MTTLESRLDLGPLPSAVPCARLHARAVLKEWNLGHLADDAEVIISELTTNALKASWSTNDARPISLHLLASRQHLMIQVWDALSAPPDPRPHAIDAETGRGLEIVSLLSERWGFYHPVGGGKTVWAALEIPAAPSDLWGVGMSEHRPCPADPPICMPDWPPSAGPADHRPFSSKIIFEPGLPAETRTHASHDHPLANRAQARCWRCLVWCGFCWFAPDAACTEHGQHLARYLRAHRHGLIGREDLTMVCQAVPQLSVGQVIADI